MKRLIGILVALAFCGLPAMTWADTLTQSFEHELLVNAPPQSWEHRIDIPEALAQKGHVFIRRALAIEGMLVIEREELTRTYYYIKVRLPKFQSDYMMGRVKVDLETSTQLPPAAVFPPPANLEIFKYTPALRPALTWKGDEKYSATTLYDVDSGATVMERVVVNMKSVAVDEGWLQKHHYRWAVKQGDETGRYSKEAQIAFRIEEKNGVVVIITE
ncbi:MAG: hypothetical protein HQM09_11090 [Candidatus Riflebacteria bacterium]|nr:hypothetical protein [Candidatus Riflebacteria bacterium]